MPSRTSHPGTRRAHYRNGKPVRAASIKHPKTQQRRRQVSRQVRSGRAPLLWGAGILASLGALEAILAGRWFTGGALLFGAGALLVTHHAWQAHKRRQARKASSPRPTRAAAQQRREALEKARAAHQPQQDPKPDPAQAPKPEPAADEKPAWMGTPQMRYDDMVATNARQRKLGIPELVSPGDYEEFYDGPGKIKPRPTAEKKAPTKPPAAEPGPWQAPPASNGGPKSHEESVAQSGHRCDCAKCTARRRTEFWSNKKKAGVAK